jgi:Asp-tRNA(Asn)/Glu-tRNA(Gln) amidotransferase A subunit family amidase
MDATYTHVTPEMRRRLCGVLEGLWRTAVAQRPRLVDYEVVELAAMLRAGKISSVELTQAYLDRINTLNGPLETYANTGYYNAFVRINADEALAAAKAADQALSAARRGGPPVSLLCGIPMGIKDSVGIKGFSTQDGSPAFALILSTILGPAPFNDPQTLSAPDPFPHIPMTARPGRKPLAGTTIGVPQTDWMISNGQIKAGVSPQSVYGPGHQAVFNRLVGQLESLGANVIEFPGLDMTDHSLNPYFSNPDVLATVDGSPVSPSAAVVNANRYEVRYVDAVADFCSSGIPSASSVTTLTAQYGRLAPGATAPTFTSADTFNGGITAAVRYEGEQRRRTLINNYAAALNAHGVDFMLVFSLGDVIGLRSGGGPGFPVYRAYYQVPNALGWPMVSFPVGYVQGLAVSAQFWGPRFSEPALVQAMIDYQAHCFAERGVTARAPATRIAITRCAGPQAA